jgi:hypothetical protein
LGALQERIFVAKNKDENDKLERYARIIQELQHDLGFHVNSFPNAGMPAFKFYDIEGSKILEANQAHNNSYSHSSNNNNNDISEAQMRRSI